MNEFNKCRIQYSWLAILIFWFQTESSDNQRKLKNNTSETNDGEKVIRIDGEQNQGQKQPLSTPGCLKVPNARKSVLQNASFILLISNWFLTGGVYKSCLAHEPQRIVHLGYSIKSGAESLAINGGLQFVSRDPQMINSQK